MAMARGGSSSRGVMRSISRMSGMLLLLLVSSVAVLMSSPAGAAAAGAAAAAAAGEVSVDFDAASCPQLEGIVRSAVQAALQREIALAAGLLRIFFHDCFPQGCDASVLLKTTTSGKSEQTMGPNTTLQPRALQLIEDIRAKVHAACGPTVSCADITALATRDAVVVSGGPSYAVPLGQRDSLAPASEDDVNALPSPFTASVPALLRAFRSRGLGDAADLVALSGAHTVGRAICGFFQGRTDNDPFVRKLKADCARNPNRLQQLDVVTPDAFDNAYFVALNTSRGVFTSDMALIRDAATAPIVRRFAQSKDAFFAQFANSMIKLSNLPRNPAGEIRRTCFATNNARRSDDDALIITAEPAAAAIDRDEAGEGLAAGAASA